jgi:hypothetical protein
MRQLVEAHKTVARTARPDQLIPVSQTAPEEIWSSLMPIQKQAVFRTIVLLCRQLMDQRQGSQGEVSDDPV